MAVQFEVHVPTIRDRALQMLVKMALEPEWETRFEANSYWVPAGTVHDGRDRRPSRIAGSRRRE